MDQIITQIANFFVTIFGMVDKAGFGTTGYIAWTTIFMAIAAIRILWSFHEFRQDDLGATFISFLKIQWKMALVWFLVAGSPFIFKSVASYVKGNVTSAAQGPIATQAQGLFNGMVDDVQNIWSIRPAAEFQIFTNLDPATQSMVPYNFRPSALDSQIALDGMGLMAEKARHDAVMTKVQAQQMLASSSPAKRAAGNKLLQSATQREQMATTVQNTANQQHQQAQASADAESGEDYEHLGISLKNLAGMAMGQNTFFGFLVVCICFLGSLLVIGPALVMALSATLKVLQAAVEVFTFLFGFAAMVVVVASFAVVLGPIAMISFVSDSWSRFGWNFVSFWIQAMIASVGVVVLVGIVGSAFGSLGGFMSDTALLVMNAASAGSGPLDMAIKATVAGLLFLGMGLALTFLTTFLQKSLSGITAMVHGSLHP